MARRPRSAAGGYAYHVLNRAVARLPLFEKEEKESGGRESFQRPAKQRLATRDPFARWANERRFTGPGHPAPLGEEKGTQLFFP
jgi:hypothetical protein